MKNETKSNLIVIFGSIVGVALFFGTVLIIGTSLVAVIIGLAITLPIWIYSVAKSVALVKKDQQPIVSSVTQTTSYVWHGETIPDKKEMLSNMPQRPIVLSPNEGFMYQGMYDTVQDYFRRVIESKACHGMIDVCFQVPNATPSKHVILQIMEDSDLAHGEPFDLGIYFCPDNYGPEYGERFKRNFYWESCFKESSRPDENTYLAYFGEDIGTAIQVASYILATVYYIPLNTRFTYNFDTIG